MAMEGCSGYVYRQVLPFIALVAIESILVGGNTLFKAATAAGLSYYVFISYTFLIATLLLLPFPFIIHRTRGLPPLDFSILSQFFLLGVIGFLMQICGFKGIDYSSPILSSIIGNLTPAMTFILAVIFRLNKINSRSITFYAKILGTIISISGALVVTLYEGPTILSTQKSHSLQFFHSSQPSNWIIGGLLLAADYLLLALLYIVQANIMKKYPVELVVVFFLNLFGFVIATTFGLIIDRNLEVWTIKDKIGLAATAYMGIFGTLLGTVVYAWAIHLKGPLYAAMFKPLSIVIAVVLGVVFLDDALRLGSVIGAAIISIGFYVVSWGEAKEKKEVDGDVHSLGSASVENVLLLQHCNPERV